MIKVYFKKGIFMKIKPKGANLQDAMVLISDGVKYNITQCESIGKIKIPKYCNRCGDVTTYLEYNFKKWMENAADDVYIALAKKRNELMYNSPFDYPEKEFYYLPRKLYEIGRFNDGDTAIKEMKIAYPEVFDKSLRSRKMLLNAISQSQANFNNDLIEYQDDYIKCEKCSIYKGRVYSAYGNNKDFPKLPEVFLSEGACDICGGRFSPYFISESTKIHAYSGQEIIDVDAVKHSNRDFIDTRTNEEKERFAEWISNHKNRSEAEQLSSYRSYCYEKINHPESTPKSFSAFMRKYNKENNNADT